MGAEKRANACAEERTSLRTCIVTRAKRPPEDLVRFVAGPDGCVVPDVARKLPGHGVWVLCHRAAIQDALRSKAFSRALRARIDAAEDLPDRVDALLLRRCLEQLSICNKAGLVACGSGKVNSWLEAGANGALVQAADASPDGLAKVARKYRAICEATERRPIIVSLLTIDELSLAMGRANVVHAALSEGKAATNFLAAASRVGQYRAAQFEAPAFMVAEADDLPSDVIRNTGQV
ncbi:MAG: RNA-binding protein [Alphaproteobacteria bacterium]|nr:RNA-binding protein [Alphaproteobacteria bacterium]